MASFKYRPITNKWRKYDPHTDKFIPRPGETMNDKTKYGVKYGVKQGVIYINKKSEKVNRILAGGAAVTSVFGSVYIIISTIFQVF